MSVTADGEFSPGPRDKRPAGCLHAAAGWLIAAGELVILGGCFLIMLAGLKINGQVFTEVLESTRQLTWAACSGLALAASGGGLAFFLIRLAVTRSGAWLLVAQLLVVMLVIGLVVWFHGAVPVPPGTTGKGIPAY